MKNRFTICAFLAIAAVSLLLLASCSFLDRYDPGFVERVNNRENLQKLKVGMTKKEVITVMGEPLVDEKYNQPDMWFYYTDWDWADAARTRTECTPVIFENGHLAGWGVKFYREYTHKDWVFDNPSETLKNDNPLDRR
jgi:outer membrane protein assembly factor BamE (lipoprotein component of BamABCDE complex)